MTIPCKTLNEYSRKLHYALMDTPSEIVDQAIDVIVKAYEQLNNIYTCGNGGSAAIANHLVCDCVKGVACDTHFNPRIQSLNSNDSIITAIANDIGYAQVFSKQLEWSGMPGEVLIAISSSGNSPNIVNAINEARRREMVTIAIVGFDGGDAKRIADICIHIPSHNYGIVEDASQAIMHYIAQTIRARHTTADPDSLKY